MAGTLIPHDHITVQISQLLFIEGYHNSIENDLSHQSQDSTVEPVHVCS